MVGIGIGRSGMCVLDVDIERCRQVLGSEAQPFASMCDDEGENPSRVGKYYAGMFAPGRGRREVARNAFYPTSSSHVREAQSLPRQLNAAAIAAGLLDYSLMSNGLTHEHRPHK